MSKVWYRIYTENNETFYANHATNGPSDINDQRRGETISVGLNIPYLEDLTIESGESYTIPSGAVEQYDDVTNDGTLNIDGTLVVYGTLTNNGTINGTTTTKGSARPDLMDYNEHSSAFSTETSLSNTVYYIDRVPSTASIPSLVIGLEPSPSLQNKNIEGVWGLISDVTDNRPDALTVNNYTVSITVLSDFSEYSSPSDVVNSLSTA